MRGKLRWLLAGTLAIAGLVGVGCTVEPDGERCYACPSTLGTPSTNDDDQSDPSDDDSQGDGDETEGWGSTGDAPDSDGEPPMAPGIPCDVQEVLQANCWGCHAEETKFGAPMPLASIEDFMVPTPTDPAEASHEAVVRRIYDPSRPMPSDGSLDPADAATLSDWIDAGLPVSNDDCGGGPQEPEEPIGPDALPCEPSHQFIAHGEAGVETPYVVPTQGANDLYMCFAVPSPFTDTQQATAWAPIIDDERVVHHWILYRSDEDPGASVFPCDVNIQLSMDFVAGWAPGAENEVLPDDVGLELGGAGSWYVLQLHYNNSAEFNDIADNSGVAFCTTDQPRANTAGVLTLGSSNLAIPPGAVGHEEKGTCGTLLTLFWPPEVHVLTTSPHMHEFGTAFKSEHIHNGVTSVVTDVPVFNFEDQRSYRLEPELIVRPGDALRTTCTFDNPTDETVQFGEGTGDEMCFNFALVYPIDEIPNRNCGLIL